MGGAASFTDPSTGDPSLVVQPSRGRFLAFDAVCPHAGCTVSYEPASKLFACPCHGLTFNGRTGAVIGGPAPRGLSRIQVAKGRAASCTSRDRSGALRPEPVVIPPGHARAR